MAILFPEWSRCPICQKSLWQDELIVATTAFVMDPDDPLACCSDAGMHRRCLDEWEHRDALVAKYRANDPNRNLWPDNATHMWKDSWPTRYTARSLPMSLYRAEIPIVLLNDDRLVDGATLVLAVTARTDAETLSATVLARFTVAPIQSIGGVAKRGERGIPLKWLDQPPRQIQPKPNVHYFRIEGATHPLWSEVRGAQPNVRALVIHTGGTFGESDIAVWAYLLRPGARSSWNDVDIDVRR
jgi:hypothetical protein